MTSFKRICSPQMATMILLRYYLIFVSFLNDVNLNLVFSFSLRSLKNCLSLSTVVNQFSLEYLHVMCPPFFLWSLCRIVLRRNSKTRLRWQADTGQLKVQLQTHYLA